MSTDPLDRLAPRQRETVLLVFDGLTHREIAARMGIELKTVEAHLHSVRCTLWDTDDDIPDHWLLPLARAFGRWEATAWGG